MFNTDFTYNPEKDIAKLVWWDNSTYVTTYDLEDSMLTVEGRPPYEIPIEAYQEVTDKFGEFIEIVTEKVQPQYWPRSEYTLEFEKDSDSVKVHLDIDGFIPIDDTYNHETGIISVTERQPAVIRWADFLLWYHAYEDFLNEIKHFESLIK